MTIVTECNRTTQQQLGQSEETANKNGASVPLPTPPLHHTTTPLVETTSELRGKSVMRRKRVAAKNKKDLKKFIDLPFPIFSER